jgi:hypothetical protein
VALKKLNHSYLSAEVEHYAQCREANNLLPNSPVPIAIKIEDPLSGDNYQWFKSFESILTELNPCS